MLHKGVFSDAFQITTFPQTHTNAAFQDKQPPGKLKAEITLQHPRDAIAPYIR